MTDIEASAVPPAQDDRQRALGPAANRAKRNPTLMSWGLPLVAILIVVGFWEMAATLFGIREYILPAPTRVANALWVSRSLLAKDTLVTLREILVGFSLAILISIPTAVLIVSVRLIDRALYPLMIVSQTVPKIAVAPLFVVWFGFGSWPKYLTTFLICFFPVVIDTIIGLRSVSPGSIELMRSMGASRTRMVVELRLPASLPYVFSGIKVAITLAVVGAVVAEFVGSSSGLGYELLQANSNLNTPLLFAALVVLTIIGLVLYYLTELLERILIPWHITQRSTAMAGTP